MTKSFRLILTLCWLTGFARLNAQNYSYVHYDIKDGLPSATVYDITQDKDGFLWFGTENGLSRFDGKNFRNFTTRDGLPDNSILCVHGDHLGRVFFSPFTYPLYYYLNDTIFKLPMPEAYKVDMTNIGNFVNKENKVYLSSFGEAYVLERDSLMTYKRVFGYSETETLTNRIFDTLVALRTKDSLVYFYDSGRRQSFPMGKLMEGAYIFNDDAKFIRLDIPYGPDLVAKKYFPNRTCTLYSKGFLYIFSSANGQLLYKIYVEKFSSAYFDSEENLWISTLGDGVYRYPSFLFRSRNFGSNSEIFSITKLDDKLLAGTDFSKVLEFPDVNNIDSFSTIDYGHFAEVSLNPIPRMTKRNRIYTMLKDGDDVYIGSDGFFLKKSKSKPLKLANIFPVKDIDIVDDRILISTGHCTVLADKRTLTVTDTLLPYRTTCGTSYHGDYYLGTIGGLVKIDGKSKKLIQLNSTTSKLAGRISAIKRGTDDDLWVATGGNGLLRLKNDQIAETLNEDKGLSSNICTSLLVDSTTIWLGTNNGLNRIERKNGQTTVVKITTANGLNANFINTIFTFGSHVYIGTADGLNLFNKNLLVEKSICNLHVMEVWENNKRLKMSTAFTFPFNAAYIQIKFTAISFRSAGDITYSYQMKGLDNNWIKTTDNQVTFPTLPHGQYTFNIKAINKFGVESQVKSLSITIRPAWWQTWLFQLVASLVVISLILAIYQYNIRNLRRKEQTKRDFEVRYAALEQRALQAQMNPHFIFNALNSIQTFILNLDAEGANNYLTSFASLIRQTLENSMQPLIALSSEIKYLETYLSLEKLRFREKFNFRISLDDNIDAENTLLPGMLLQPYIENAIRHGIQHRNDNLGLITIQISKDEQQVITYTITDNGVGRQRAGELKSQRHIEYQSRGISINEKRIAAINNQLKSDITARLSDIVDENGQISGTAVEIRIPPLNKQL